MLEKDHCDCVRGLFKMKKATVEQEAREAYAAGLSPNEACAYPFYSPCGLHWLAHYNLCIPLPKPQGAAA